MAEGLLRSLYGDRYEAYSAGTHPSGVSPHAVLVMREVGIDVSAHASKSIDAFRGTEFDWVVTVCDDAKESCPWFPGAKRYLHQGFHDPSDFAGSEDEGLAGFRRARDEIRRWIVTQFAG